MQTTERRLEITDLAVELFLPLAGNRFIVTDWDGRSGATSAASQLELVEVTPLARVRDLDGKVSFSLVFRLCEGPAREPGLHSLIHATFTVQGLYLSGIRYGLDHRDRGSYYECIFN